MIILGDISGIQTYLFDVAEAGGGQARRLRARSFYIQLLAEAAALRVLQTLGWPRDSEHYLCLCESKLPLEARNSVSWYRIIYAVSNERKDSPLCHQSKNALCFSAMI